MRPFRELYGYDAPYFMDLEFGESRDPKEKKLVAGKSKHIESFEGEFAGHSKSTEDICR